VGAMSKYIENVNTYLSHKKIKQTFVSMQTGIESSKLSRILNETQDVSSIDMEKIASSLGKKAKYFLSENFQVESYERDIKTDIAFYAGNPGPDQEKFAMKLIDLIENVDEILGAKGRLIISIGE
jgi:hypothetical protein